MSRLLKRQVAIIMYHRIDMVANHPWSTTPTIPQDFDREIKYLHQRYRVISLDELTSALPDPDRPLAPKTAVVTIDDGYRDIYVNAYPILKKYGVPATVFPVTGHIGTGNLFWWDKVGYVIWKTKLKTLELGELGTHRLASVDDRQRLVNTVVARLKQLSVNNRDELIERLVTLSEVDIPLNIGEQLVLSWDEIREMNRNGVSFGAHTVSHPILTRLPLETARKEIVDSKQHLEEELDQEITTFCYPNGKPGDFNDDIVEILKSDGFRCAVTSSPAFVSPSTNLYELPRILGSSGFDSFKLRMCLDDS